MTDWVRSLERPLLDSRAFLDNEADRNDLNEADAEVTNDALPAEE